MSWRVVATLLFGSMLAVSVEGQRVGGGFHGGGVIVSGHGASFGGRHGVPFGPFRGNFGFNRFRNFGGYGGFWIPWDYPWDYSWGYWDLPSFRDSWYENWARGLPQPNETYDARAQSGSAAPVIIVRSDLPAPTRSPEPPKLFEVPVDKESSPSATQSPTLFVLTNGTRLEAHRYVLTLNSLDIELERGRRTVPISQLDLPQTIAANRERGIELKVPRSTREIFLGF
jgi:hypothetical protein